MKLQDRLRHAANYLSAFATHARRGKLDAIASDFDGFVSLLDETIQHEDAMSNVATTLENLMGVIRAQAQQISTLNSQVAQLQTTQLDSVDLSTLNDAETLLSQSQYVSLLESSSSSSSDSAVPNVASSAPLQATASVAPGPTPAAGT